MFSIFKISFEAKLFLGILDALLVDLLTSVTISEEYVDSVVVYLSQRVFLILETIILSMEIIRLEKGLVLTVYCGL